MLSDEMADKSNVLIFESLDIELKKALQRDKTMVYSHIKIYQKKKQFEIYEIKMMPHQNRCQARAVLNKLVRITQSTIKKNVC